MNLRELDALIAEHVMEVERGYWSNSEQKQINIGWFDDYTIHDPCDGIQHVKPVDWIPEFATDIKHTWSAIEVMRKRNWDIDISVRPEYEYGCRVAPHGHFNTADVVFETAKSMPEAVCRAILVALKKIEASSGLRAKFSV